MIGVLLAFALAAAVPPVTEENAVREFAATCVAHFSDLAGLKRAAAGSPRGYVLGDAGNPYVSRVWTAAAVSIAYYEGGVRSSQFAPQCTLTADLTATVDRNRLDRAVAALPGASALDAATVKWLGGRKAWLLEGSGSVVVKVDAARPGRIILSLQPVFPDRSTR